MNISVESVRKVFPSGPAKKDIQKFVFSGKSGCFKVWFYEVDQWH